MLPGQTRVLLVDHETLLRESLGGRLDAERDICVVGCVDSSSKAIEIINQTNPQVIILDADRPEGVMESFMRLRQAAAGARFLILSAHEHPALLQKLLALGISGYLMKSVTVMELVTAIRTVVERDGRVVLSVARTSIGMLGHPADSAELSRREREIMQRIAEGLSNGQIARRLCISEGTVKRHVHRIFVKLGAVSRIDAVNKYSLASARLNVQESAS